MLPLMRAHSEQAVKIDPPAVDAAPAEGLQTAVLAGGCFWGIQAVYQHTKGVTKAVSGYAGGDKKERELRPRQHRPHQPRRGRADHVRPARRLLRQAPAVFFSVAHNPTELNRQGPDTGAQYRTEIFPQTEEQAKVAKAYIAQLDAAKSFPTPIVTKTGTMKAAFYPAEAYHQDYATLHPSNPYIVFNDAPKVENLKRMFGALFRDKPVLVADAERAGH